MQESEEGLRCELCGEILTEESGERGSVVCLTWGEIDEDGDFIETSSTYWHEDCFDKAYKPVRM